MTKKLSQEYYKVTQLETIMGLSRKTVRKLIDDGTIPFARIGGIRLVHKDWLREAMENRREDIQSEAEKEAERLLAEMGSSKLSLI